MAECLKQVGYDSAEPALHQVKGGMRSDAWIKELKAKV
jgi:hypothetical protein